MTSENGSHVSTTDAINAMRQRGIDDPESLVSSTSADRIIETCKHGDREGWSKRLLVWKIKQGGVDVQLGEPRVNKRRQMEDAFAQVTSNFSEGSVTESHKRLQRRRDYDEDCDGMMVVVEDPTFPSLVVRCDGCGFEASYPFKALAARAYAFTKPGATDVIPDRPPVASRPVPDPQPQVPPEQWRRPADHPSTRELHPPRLDEERSLRWRR